MTNPRVREPLSPMKMEAGFQLKRRNAKREEINAPEISIMKRSSFWYPTVKKVPNMIILTIAAKPSIRLSALVNPTTARTVKGSASQPKESSKPKKVPRSEMIIWSKDYKFNIHLDYYLANI